MSQKGKDRRSPKRNTRQLRDRKERKFYTDDFLGEADDDIEGPQSFDLEEKLETERFNKSLVKELKGTEFNLAYIQQYGFTTPLLFKDRTGLGIRIPGSNFTVSDVKTCVGSKRMLDVMDVRTQKNLELTMKEWQEYYDTQNKDRLLNVISLEFSHTKLENYVESPTVVRQLDWVDRVWPRHLKNMQTESTNVLDEMMYPKVQKYCLMSVKGCYTDFHVDFGGTSVWYHILKGAKVFWLIPPTEKNLENYQAWVLSGKQNDTFFGDNVDECSRVYLQDGDTFFIPSGWIHAVYTPKDSLVFGGNFLHSFGIDKQIRIATVEETTKVPQKFRYPFFTEMLWYTLNRYVHCLLGMNFIRNPTETPEEKDFFEGNKYYAEKKLAPEEVHLSPQELLGLKSIVLYLHQLPIPRKNVPAIIHDPVGLLRAVRHIVSEHRFDNPEKAVTGLPILVWPGERAEEVGKIQPHSEPRRKAAKIDLTNSGRLSNEITTNIPPKLPEIDPLGRRLRCGQCQSCTTTEDCKQCAKCVSKSGICSMRECLKPLLPNATVCDECGLDGWGEVPGKAGFQAKRSGPSNLLECSICSKITHALCMKASPKAIGIVNDDLPNSWECIACVEKSMTFPRLVKTKSQSTESKESGQSSQKAASEPTLTNGNGNIVIPVPPSVTTKSEPSKPTPTFSTPILIIPKIEKDQKLFQMNEPGTFGLALPDTVKLEKDEAKSIQERQPKPLPERRVSEGQSKVPKTTKKLPLKRASTPPLSKVPEKKSKVQLKSPVVKLESKPIVKLETPTKPEAKLPTPLKSPELKPIGLTNQEKELKTKSKRSTSPDMKAKDKKSPIKSESQTTKDKPMSKTPVKSVDKQISSASPEPKKKKSTGNGIAAKGSLSPQSKDSAKKTGKRRTSEDPIKKKNEDNERNIGTKVKVSTTEPEAKPSKKLEEEKDSESELDDEQDNSDEETPEVKEKKIASPIKFPQRTQLSHTIMKKSKKSLKSAFNIVRPAQVSNGLEKPKQSTSKTPAKSPPKPVAINYWKDKNAMLKVFNWLDLSSLNKVLRVCKEWNTIGLDPILWKTLDLSQKKITASIMAGIIRRQPHAIIFDWTEISKHQLKWIIGRLPQLRELSLQGVPWKTVEALQTCYCPTLASLDLGYVGGLNDYGLREILAPPADSRPGLTDSKSRLRQLKCLRLAGALLSDVSLRYITLHAGSISKLDISTCSRITDAGIAQLGSPDSPTLQNLTYLNISGCPQLTNISLDHLKKCRNLVFLDVQNVSQITLAGLQKYLDEIPSKTTIKVLSDFNLKNLPPYETMTSANNSTKPACSNTLSSMMHSIRTGVVQPP